MNTIQEAAQRGPVPYWMLHLASFPPPSASEGGTPRQGSGLDPQGAWYVLHTNISGFLESVPDNQKMLLHVEDLIGETEQTLRQVAGWLHLRTDDQAIEAMKHPERSPYACFGPASARYGNESYFLRSPVFSATVAEGYSLDGPLSWRPKPQEFLPEVKELARQFGYQ